LPLRTSAPSRRFRGSAGFVSLNLHLHSLVPDGVFSRADDGSVSFVPLPPPTTEDIVEITRRLLRRVAKILSREDHAAGDENPDELARAQADSVQATLPGLPRRPLSAPTTDKNRCALIEGFSLHADVRVHESDRLGLERLCRYLLRPPIGKDRLSLADDGSVRYRFRRPAPSGATELCCSPVEFLRRLSTLIPPPHQNTLRYHGVFAARSKLRALVVPREETSDQAGPGHAPPLARREPERGRTQATRPRRLDWAALLRRVFDEDITRCPECDGRLEVIACLTDPDVVGDILEHLGLLPGCPPRAPPTSRPAAELA
jgi:hypothetical protein